MNRFIAFLLFILTGIPAGFAAVGLPGASVGGASDDWSIVGDLSIGGNLSLTGTATLSEYVFVKKDGSDGSASGAYLGIANAAGNRQWLWQLDASNNLDLKHYDGSGYSTPLTVETSSNDLRLTGDIVTTGDDAAVRIGNTASTHTESSVILWGGDVRRSWKIGPRDSSGVFEFTPSTSNGGATFTSPVLWLDGSSGAAKFTGKLTVDGDLAHGKACASGYTRIAPGLCDKDTINLTVLTRDACTEFTLPSGASAVVLHLRASANAANAVGSRSTSIHAYSDSGCSSSVSGVGHSAFGYEFTALASGVLGSDDAEYIVKDPGAGSLWVKYTDDAGNNGTGFAGIVNYYDN